MYAFVWKKRRICGNTGAIRFRQNHADEYNRLYGYCGLGEYFLDGNAIHEMTEKELNGCSGIRKSASYSKIIS